MVSQKYRIVDALRQMENVWTEILNGKCEDDILQDAVYLQTMVNRIVWKLNERLNERSRPEQCMKN